MLHWWLLREWERERELVQVLPVAEILDQPKGVWWVWNQELRWAKDPCPKAGSWRGTKAVSEVS